MLRSLSLSLRAVVGVFALLVVLWSFAWVISRPWRTQQLGANQTLLRVLHWGEKNEDAIIAGLIHDFERENPDIKVQRINLGQAAAVNTKLQTMLAGGEPPDVFYLAFEKVATLAQKGLLADIERFIEADRTAGRPTLALDDFFPNVLKCFRYDGRQVGQGTLVGLPKDFTTLGIYYNRDLFRKAGVPEPSPSGWTWDEYLEAARAIGRLDGCYGADFPTWEAIVRVYLWSWGLDFASDNYTRFHFRDADVQQALTRLQSWFHLEGRTLLSAKTQLETGLEPFLAGNVGMAGPFGRWKVPTYRLINSFDWDFAPLPHAPGKPPRNGVFTVAWSIARDTKHPDASWRLVKFLCGPRGQELASKPGLAIPSLISVARGPVFSDPNQEPQNDQVYIDSAAYAEAIDWPAEPKFQDQLKTRLEQIFKQNTPVADAMVAVDRDWQENLREAGRTDYPPMAWGPIWRWTAAIGGLLTLALLVALLWGRRGPAQLAEERAGYAMVSPWVIGFLAFTFFPVVLSLLLSFTNWNALGTLDLAQYVGVDNYTRLLTQDRVFHNALLITAAYVLLVVPISQAAALIAALLMNHDVPGIYIFRSIWYLPSVLAGVGMAVMFKWVFHHENGLLNGLLEPLLSVIGKEPPRWFERDADRWAVPAFVILSLWSIGGTMMIYLAGLKGVSRELYEAAEIDGATAWSRFRNVTLPMLSPVIFFNVIIAVIAAFQIFTQVYVMTGGGPGESTHFYVFYLYKKAFDLQEMGYACAMAWLLLFIVLAMTSLVFAGSRRWVYYEALKA